MKYSGGGGNFVAEIVLKTATDNNPSQVCHEHEYLLCYARNRKALPKWKRTNPIAKRIIAQYTQIAARIDNPQAIERELRAWIRANKHQLKGMTHYNCVDAHGVYSRSANPSNPHPGGYTYDILHPRTGLPCPRPANGWRWPELTFKRYLQQNAIEWGPDHSTQPHVKKRIEEAVEYLRSVIYEDNRTSTQQLALLLGAKRVFENPKPLALIQRLIEYATEPDSLILDFFSGSATTAHAVMQQNAEDGGKRRYICVQLPEETPPGSEARRAGYTNICEIGKERIRRAGQMIREAHGLMGRELDTGFRVLRVDAPNELPIHSVPSALRQGDLLQQEMLIRNDRTELDLLFGCMVSWGLPLSLPLREEMVQGQRVHIGGSVALVACFERIIVPEMVMRIAEMKPQHIMLRDECFAHDMDKINLFEQLKQLCGWSDDEAYKRIRVL